MMNQIRQYLTIARESLKKENNNPPVDRNEDELGFLPASIEILETPPSPLARTMAFILAAIIPVILCWSWFGYVDTVAITEGQIIPVGKVKYIQPLEIGKVREILVQEGQHVSKGDLLIRLDTTVSEVDTKQLMDEYEEASANASRLELLLNTISHSDFNPLVQEVRLPSSNKIATLNSSQQHILQNDLQYYINSLRHIAEVRTQKEAAIAAIQSDLNRLNTLVPLHVDMEKSVRSLYDKGHASKLEWLKVKEQQIQTTEQVSIEEKRLDEALASLRAVDSEQQTFMSEFSKNRNEELLQHQQKARLSHLALDKARERHDNQYLTAPVSGTIQQLSANTIGGIVEPAQPIMKIVPDDARLEVEAKALNKDIGFIHVGQLVDIKLEAYPYTTYGQLHGKVLSVSRDTMSTNEAEAFFPVLISLDDEFITVKEVQKRLQAGMVLTAEVKTGSRRLLNYFLSPLQRYKAEAFNER